MTTNNKKENNWGKFLSLPVTSYSPTWSAVILKKTHLILMSSKLEPLIWSHDTGHQIPCFDRCQLIIIWMSKIKDVNSKPRLGIGSSMAAILQIIGWQTCSLGLLCTLILDIHVMINWHLSKQGIRWPVSRDHMTGPSLQLIEVKCFFWSWPLTNCWFFDWIAGSLLVNLLKTGQDC